MAKSSKRGEIDWCGQCMKRFSYLDWAEPAKALENHYLSGECPKALKA